MTDPLEIRSNYVRAYEVVAGTLKSRGRLVAGGPPPPPPPSALHYDLAKFRTKFTGPPFTPTPTDWSGLVAGTYFPNDGKFDPSGYYHPVTGVQATIGLNCGVKPGSTLTLVSTDTTYSTSGTQAAPIVISNMRFRCQVILNASWLKFVNCEFEGNPLHNGELVKAFTANHRNNVFEECTFSPSTPYSDTSPTKGYGFTYNRCLVEHCADGIACVANGSVYTGYDMSVYVYGSFFGNPAMVSPDPGAAGGLTDNSGHVDTALQLRGGNHFVFIGNTILGFVTEELGIGDAGVPTIRLSNGWRITGIKYPGPTPKWPGVVNVDGTKGSNEWRATTSNFMFSPTLGAVSDWQMKQNLWDGGGTIININNTSTDGTGIVIQQNLMGRRGQRDRWGVMSLSNLTQPITVTGNLDGRTVIGTAGQTTRHPAYNTRNPG